MSKQGMSKDEKKQDPEKEGTWGTNSGGSSSDYED
jgi:hypothetical protein